MKQGCIFKGLRPDHAPGPFYECVRAVGFQGKMDHCFWGEGQAAGKANAAVAEVNGPGVVVPLTGQLVAAGNFGKAEVVVTGDANRTAAIDRLVFVLANIGVTAGEQLILTARRKMAGGAVGGNMLLYGQKQSILNQQAGSTAGRPVRTVALALEL